MPLIQSRQNPKIKRTRRLLSRHGRRKEGLFVVEGLRHVGAALEADAPCAYLLWAPDRLTSDFGRQLVAKAESRCPVYAVQGDVLDSISPREHSQGIIAAVAIRPTPLEALTPARHPWVVAITAPQNPGNIGTVLRTMDAVGANALVLLEGGAAPYHPAAVRASMGALFWLPIVQSGWEAFLAWAQQHGYHLYGSSARGTAAYTEVGYTKPAVLLLGSERHGLSPAQREACETVVTLPMEGHGTSLNLAIAAGVLLYAMKARLESPAG